MASADVRRHAIVALLAVVATSVAGCSSAPTAPAPGTPARARAPAEPLPRCSPRCPPTPAERIAETFQRIKRDYPDQADDQRLVATCRDTIAATLPDGVRAPVAPAPAARDPLGQIARYMEAVRHEAGDAVDDEALADACIQGMTKTLERAVLIRPADAARPG